MLDMDDDVAVVEQHPATLALALASNRPGSDLAQLVLDLVDDRAHLAVVRRRADDEGVGDDQLFGHVEGDDVVSEFVRRCLGGGVDELDRSVGRGHAVSLLCSAGAPERYSVRLAMYWTTPSGTRYQTGSPLAARARHSVEEMASAGISITVTRSVGRPVIVWSSIRVPGLVQATKCASSNTLSASCQVRIWPSASAPVMKKRSEPGRASVISRRVSIV